MDYASLYLPPWGALPVEQFLIRFWDYSTTIPAEQQRLALLSDFCTLERIPREWYDDPTEPRGYRAPTQNDVNIILRPWRSDDMRKLAFAILQTINRYPILIRDHYDASNSSHDDMMGHWIRTIQNNNSMPWAIINEEGCFSFARGDQDDPTYWTTAAVILPEIVGPELARTPGDDTIRWKDIPPWCEYRRDLFKTQLSLEKGGKPAEWMDDACHMIESCASHLHISICAMIVILVDKVAFETGYPLLLYVDHYLNVIRQTRFDLNKDTLMEILDDWFESSLTPWMWQDSEVGYRYKVTGDLGQRLYQLMDEDVTNPG